MEHWRAPYLGLREIPAGLDDFELTTFFTYSAEERAIISARRSGLHRLAVALHIGFVRMSGRCLDAVDRVPKRLWLHIGEQIGFEAPDIATLRSLYSERARTLVDHQVLAYESLGFRQMTEHQKRYVVRWLREALAGSTSGGSILPELKRWFYEHRILLVADRELKRLIVSATVDIEQKLVSGLELAYKSTTLERWGAQLHQLRSDGQTTQTWLWAAPLKQSTVQIAELFAKVDYLKALGVQDPWPTVVNDAAVRLYGKRCAYRAPSANRRITSLRRSIEIACFMRYALCTTSDQLLIMLRRWIRKMVNKAAVETAPSYPDAKERLQELAQAVRDLAADKALSDNALRARLDALAESTLKDVRMSRAAMGRAWLIEHPQQARAILAKLLTLPLEAEGAHVVLNAFDVLRIIYASRSRELPTDVQVDFGRRWKDALSSADRNRALAAFEWATLLKLRIALRNGSVFLAHSFAFRGHASLLIPRANWQAHRHSHYGQLKLPVDPQEFLGPIKEQLALRTRQFSDSVAAGRVRLDLDGMHLDKVAASPEANQVLALRRALYAERAPGQIAEMMLQIDSKVRFSWLLLGREPHSRSELLLTYAGIMALSTAMSAAQVARMMPGLSAEAIRQMTKRLADDRKLRLASDAALQYVLRFEIAKHWGRAELASSDMMSLETPRAIWQARADPRRKTNSIGVYTHVMDRWGIFYDQPIVLNRRQAGAAIEGVVRQSAVEDVGQLAVDTHGYTHFAMAQAKLLRFDLCPQLADMSKRRLHAFADGYIPDNLLAVMRGDLDEAKIEAAYDELVRVASSVRVGQCSAVQMMDRYGSDARGQAVYEAGVDLGKALCAIFQMDYHLNAAFRGEMRHVLNRGESMHTLQRAIHDGMIPVDLAKRDDSLAGISSALSLMCNIVMGWNAEHMQRAYERIRAEGAEPVGEDMRRVAPTNIEGINLRGTFEFPVEKYAERILPSSVAASQLEFRRKS